MSKRDINGNWTFVVMMCICSSILLGCTNDVVSQQKEDSAQPVAETPTTPAAELVNTTSSVQQPKLENPFSRRIEIDNEFPEDAEWINTGGGKLRLKDLRGKFVLMDFWTYCCINCIHVLPELKKLEQEFPDQLVVVGVHCAKFDAEKGLGNIAEAVKRYEIEHPVINDPNHVFWKQMQVQSWPTMYMLDPEGKVVWGASGETKYETLAPLIKKGIAYYRQEKLLDESPIRFQLEANKSQPTPLRFPGKVLADGASERLFISDSNHNRIVISDLNGKLLDSIGSGEIGRQDGSYEAASFDHPQGVVLDGDTLYVSDTENHTIRAVDLKTKQVSTIAGIGTQATSGFPGYEQARLTGKIPQRWAGPPKTTALNSPWALYVQDEFLYIAMAGPHQIWRMPLDQSEIGPYAGNGREDIVDGPLLPRSPYTMGFSSFAQPSGLASDGKWLFVADSEGSSIRAVPFDPKDKVRTVVGSESEPYGRLFDFGDIDGPKEKAKLQHALGVVYNEGQIYIADTYNNKIKVVDADTGAVRTIAGNGQPGSSDKKPSFDEPAGISFAKDKLYVADTNNHSIRVIDVNSGEVSTLEVKGLTAPNKKVVDEFVSTSVTKKLAVKPTQVKSADGKVSIDVSLDLPPGWKINPLAPMGYYLNVKDNSGALDQDKIDQGMISIESPSNRFSVDIPTATNGKGTVVLSFDYFYCQDGGEGLCRMGSVQWTIPLEVEDSASESAVPVSLSVF